jgi:hypothetical protein
MQYLKVFSARSLLPPSSSHSENCTKLKRGKVIDEDVGKRTYKNASHEPLQCQILRGLGVGQEGEEGLENLVFLGSVLG